MLRQSLHHLFQPPDMYANVICELWVETCAHNVALPDSNNVVEITPMNLCRGIHGSSFHPRRAVGEYAQDFHLGLCRILASHLYTGLDGMDWRIPHQQLLNNRRPDEHTRKRGRGVRFGQQFRLRQKGQLNVGYKALNLSTKMISMHADVQPSNKLLAALLCGIRFLGKENEPRASAPGWLSRSPA